MTFIGVVDDWLSRAIINWILRPFVRQTLYCIVIVFLDVIEQQFQRRLQGFFNSVRAQKPNRQ